MKKFFALSLAAMLAVGAVSCGSEEEPAPVETPAEETPAEETPAEETPAEEVPAETAAYTDGVYTGETEPNEKGMKMVAEVTVTGGVISDVKLDEIGPDGSVRDASVETTTENATVGAQLDAIAAEIVATNNNLVITADGLADGVTGSTFHAQPYVDAVNIALAQAQ